MMVMDPAYVPGIGITDNLAIRNGELVTVKHVKADGTVDTKGHAPTQRVKLGVFGANTIECNMRNIPSTPVCAYNRYFPCVVVREDDALCGKEARFYEPIEHRKGNL